MLNKRIVCETHLSSLSKTMQFKLKHSTRGFNEVSDIVRTSKGTFS